MIRVMGQQKRLKQSWRKLKYLKKKNEMAEVAEELEMFPEFKPNEDLNQIEEFEDTDAILKLLMPVLPIFSGKNFKLWAIKMEGLLGSIDLWKFVQEAFINLGDKHRNAIALFLIISALDENILSNILYEFGERRDAKIFWDILEMKYSMEGSEKAKVDGVVAKGVCVESIIAGIKAESMYLADNRVVCDFKETPCDAEICEVKFDDNYVSHDEWLNMMHEKHLIDELLFGEKSCLPPYTNHMQDNMFALTELAKEVEDMIQPTMSAKKDEGSKGLSKVHDDKNQYGFVYESNIVFECANIHNQEETTKLEEIASIKEREARLNTKNVNLQSRKEKLNHYLMTRKVKMKLHQQRKRNKHGPFNKKAKMKCFVVSLGET